VVHPRTKLISTFAPISIGSNCIISERSSIGFQSRPAEDEIEGVVIENGVIVEVGAVVEAKKIGEGCVIEVNAKIGKGAVIGKVRRHS
jgi:dynactin-6